jgi:acetyl-CoA acetyltransferase family protein
MTWTKAFVPYGAGWSSPFVKWQGSFAPLHSLELCADVARRALAARHLPAEHFDALHLGTTIPQPASFYGAPWVAGLVGAPGVTGPTYAQACATGARTIAGAASDVENGVARCVLALTADRCSNGPHLVYPNAANPGARPDVEDWVWDNFARDPWAGEAMIQTAENVARAAGVTREEQEAVTLLRFAQYQDALADGAAFQRRYLVAPYEVNPTGKKILDTVASDEGVFPTTREGLAKLKPVQKDGSVTFGTQTHPADGNAGLVVTTRERAAELGRDPKVLVQLCAAGVARAKKAHMAQAVAPAARQALERAGVTAADCAAVKTHNPFAVNDVIFARELGLQIEDFNRYGSSLVYGHPQAPTGMRLVVELIEELALRGGGWGLFAGCAAGDTAMALVLKVG